VDLVEEEEEEVEELVRFSSLPVRIERGAGMARERERRDEEKSGAYQGTRTRYDPKVIQDRG